MIEPTTLTRLWRQHADRLLVIARATGEPAEDAVQEAFVALAQQSELPRDPLGWLVRATRNRLLDWHRSRARRESREQRCATPESWFVAGDAVLDGHEVTEWLGALPRKQREVIVMHLWGGMSFRQIADATGDSPATANRHYQRGLDTLRQKTETKPTRVLP